MSSLEEIQQKVVSITSKTLNVDVSTLGPESNFVTDLGADSLDQVELVMAFEAEFGSDIPEEQAKKLNTVKDVVEYIHQNSK